MDGWEEIQVPGQLTQLAAPFPAVFNRSAPATEIDTSAIIAEVKSRGAVLLRGLPLKTAQDFWAFLQRFPGLGYGSFRGGGGPRTAVIGPVHFSTFTPKHLEIPFHHELAYLSEFPEALGFFSATPAAVGGETPVLPSDELAKQVAAQLPEFYARLKAHGVIYTRVLDCARAGGAEDGLQRSWQAAMLPPGGLPEGTSLEEERRVAEEAARATGAAEVTFDAATGAMTVVSRALPGILEYDMDDNAAGGRREVFFNAVVLLHPAGQDAQTRAVPWQVTFGDGSPMPDDAVRATKAIMGGLRAAVKWETGDVMFVHNRLAMHARNSFEGERLTLAVIMDKFE